MSEKAQKFHFGYSNAEISQQSETKLADAMLIIGFDAEWVIESADDPDDDDGDGDNSDRPLPGQTPRNRILSYQYACRYNGQVWSGIVYTLTGARMRYPGNSAAEIAKFPKRIRFADLLAIAIK